jgi:hypothetical protein
LGKVLVSGGVDSFKMFQDVSRCFKPVLILLGLLSQWDALQDVLRKMYEAGTHHRATPRPHEKNTLSRSRHIGNNGWFFHKLIVGLVEITFLPPFLVLIKWINVTVYRQEVRGDIITGLGANKRAATDYQCAQVKGLGVSRWPLISVETLRRSLTDLTAQGKKLCDSKLIRWLVRLFEF